MLCVNKHHFLPLIHAFVRSYYGFCTSLCFITSVVASLTCSSVHTPTLHPLHAHHHLRYYSTFLLYQCFVFHIFMHFYCSVFVLYDYHCIVYFLLFILNEDIVSCHNVYQLEMKQKDRPIFLLYFQISASLLWHILASNEGCNDMIAKQGSQFHLEQQNWNRTMKFKPITWNSEIQANVTWNIS